ncbi:hypothetical protein DRO48_03590 [Candidatus Bathyarchaeota archaeon]|nr:MAG: hypothetical protein DRO48_03590 [Candidatus Bathyarchaeota archaeon]
MWMSLSGEGLARLRPGLVDAHCHLQDSEFDEDRDDVVKRARDSGVHAIVTSSLNYEEGLAALRLSHKYEGYVYVALGLEPTKLDSEDVDAVRRLITAHRREIVAIGEVGLDYYWVREEALRELQKRLFLDWLSLAEELSLPVVVHSRSAGKYAVQIVLKSGYRRVLMHAYDGRVGWAQKAAKEGVYFSIPTSVWHSRQKQKLVKALPLESLMVETDSPVLSPIRGRRNEPANLIYAVRKIAEIKGVPPEEVAEITTKNALELFGIRLKT